MDKSKCTAFTLIEVLITTSIVVIFFGASISVYNEFAESKKTEAEIIKFKGVLELAKKKTFAADYTSCPGEFLGYRVRVNNSDYTLNLRCSGGPEVVVQNYSFSSLIQSDTPQNIDFLPLATSVTQSCTVIKNTASNICYNVNVSASAIVSSQKCNTCGTCCP